MSLLVMVCSGEEKLAVQIGSGALRSSQQLL